jgi:hypothetical protein
VVEFISFRHSAIRDIYGSDRQNEPDAIAEQIEWWMPLNSGQTAQEKTIAIFLKYGRFAVEIDLNHFRMS